MPKQDNQAISNLIPEKLPFNTSKSNVEKQEFSNLACRSRELNNLKTYQTRTDSLKPGELIKRPFVPDDKVKWTVEYPNYAPIEYTTERILKTKPSWADPQDVSLITKWNQIDGDTDRRSYTGLYEFDNKGRPINPVGRTGVTGRGQLGKWGPNHAADPIVTRWKRDDYGNKVKGPASNKHILQFVLIKRSDNGEWAIPGGMNDPGEKISQTLKREFMEEVIDVLGENKDKKEIFEKQLKEFFENGSQIYQGYVDDPRNTDNSWMETTAYNFHDEDGSVFKNIQLKAGDDAAGVKWTDFNGLDGLYANHYEFIRKTVELHDAYLRVNFGNILVSLVSVNLKKKKNNSEGCINCKCRSRDEKSLTVYMKDPNDIKRSYVPDDKTSWKIDYPDYKPLEFTMKMVLHDKPVWADDEDCSRYKWNSLDENIDRCSHLGQYKIVNGRPQNPIGRTGITGRGQLGKWGPNHAADPIVTRWKRDNEGNKVKKNQNSNYFVLQFVSIKRIDTGDWAIPGGMCDPGEKVSQTLKREFMEEATDCLGSNESERQRIEEHLREFFENGQEIYKGYVDDPRNTDNAWMETIAYNFHDENDLVFKNFKLTAGDDAGSVTWMDIDQNLNLYASHKDFIELATKLHHAHW